MKISPLGAVIAADILDVDLAKPLDDQTIALIGDAWNDQLVLRFRNQRLNDDDLLRFSRYFGELDPPGPNPYGVTFLPEYPEINVISNVRDDAGVPIGNLGDGEAVWHADMTYIDNPPEAGILYALEVPVGQGDTYFANMVAAYDDMPADLRAAIDGKILIHDAAHNSAGMLRKGYEEVRDVKLTPGARHPLAYEDPTGRVALFLGRRPHAYILGMEEDDSEALLDSLWAHASQPKYSWKNEWQAGDLVMWQNRMVLHRRDGFDPNMRRVMHRTQLKGRSPIAA
ncbi:TauD/TfdA family dioxygenase [Alphaproteobacteria bacterium]|jgi:taurine dioxygenase|nr:TauD/TfdA family dioxygenase [Alphaproteobacteria bacterium]MDC1191486.1 TauD/TfdA family dioxygenase [Candidatus Puniceispirillum sp.]MDA8942462.1 TauD/TfdA family dioxygenase [Alphaproteobacteria bacterium]MDA9012941.1 TauD/TfdA family dioxygenase [Alphaproteobacteria bacterium]MDA9133227.1 TauD/TfdA family dioxygenase [Alphaproteobacteria bacterium]